MIIFPKKWDNPTKNAKEVMTVGLRLRMAGAGALAAAAAVSAWSALGQIKAPEASPAPVYEPEQTVPLDEAEYVLRGRDGVVCVFLPDDERSPVAVTDIRLDCLRSADRSLISGGLAVADREALMTLLEDLGS